MKSFATAHAIVICTPGKVWIRKVERTSCPGLPATDEVKVEPLPLRALEEAVLADRLQSE